MTIWFELLQNSRNPEVNHHTLSFFSPDQYGVKLWDQFAPVSDHTPWAGHGRVAAAPRTRGGVSEAPSVDDLSLSDIAHLFPAQSPTRLEQRSLDRRHRRRVRCDWEDPPRSAHLRNIYRAWPLNPDDPEFPLRNPGSFPCQTPQGHWSPSVSGQSRLKQSTGHHWVGGNWGDRRVHCRPVMTPGSRLHRRHSRCQPHRPTPPRRGGADRASGRRLFIQLAEVQGRWTAVVDNVTTSQAPNSRTATLSIEDSQTRQLIPGRWCAALRGRLIHYNDHISAPGVWRRQNQCHASPSSNSCRR